MQEKREAAFIETWKVLTNEVNRKQNIHGVDKFILITILAYFLLKRHPKAYKYYVRYVRPIIFRKFSHLRDRTENSRGFLPYSDKVGSFRVPAELLSEENIKDGKEELFVLKVEDIIENQVPSALAPFRKFVKPHIELNQHPKCQLDTNISNTKAFEPSTAINNSENSERNKNITNESRADPTYEHSSSEQHNNPSNHRQTENASLGNPRKSLKEHRMPHKHNKKTQTYSGGHGHRDRSLNGLADRGGKSGDGKHKRPSDRMGSSTGSEIQDGRHNNGVRNGTEQRRRVEKSSTTQDKGDRRSMKEVHRRDRKTDKREERRKPKPPPGYPSAPGGYPTLPAGYPHVGSSSSTGNGNHIPDADHHCPPHGYPGSCSLQNNQETNGYSNNHDNHEITSNGLGTPCPPCLINGSPLFNGNVSKVIGKIKEKINDPEFQEQAERMQKQARKFIGKQAKKLLEK